MSNSRESEIETPERGPVTAAAAEAEAASSVNGGGALEDEPAADQETSPAASGAGPEAAADEAAPPDPAEELQAELEKARQASAEMLEKLQRAQAEFENIRKRLQREKAEVVRYAASDTIEKLLPIVDDFERAIAADGVTPEVKKGLELIHRRIFEVFSRAGLKEVSQHENFDPNLHFAVDRAPATEEQADHQILAVYQKGYFFKDRLVRASMVKVAVEE